MAETLTPAEAAAAERRTRKANRDAKKANRLTAAEAEELMAQLKAEREAKKAAPEPRRVGENGREGPAPSERVREACTLQHLRDYIEDANPSGRPSHTGNVRCPMPDHTDADPSCSVIGTDGDAAWHCHSCGENGTLIDAVMATQGLDFPRAVDEAAKHIGLDLARPRPGPAPGTRPHRHRRRHRRRPGEGPSPRTSRPPTKHARPSSRSTRSPNQNSSSPTPTAAQSSTGAER